MRDIHEKYSARENGDFPFAPGIGSVTQSFGLIGDPCLPCFLISFASPQERDQTSICGIRPGKVLAEDRVWIIPPASKQVKGRIGNRGSLAQSPKRRGTAGSSATRVFMSPTSPLRRLFRSPGRVPGAARRVCRSCPPPRGTPPVSAQRRGWRGFCSLFRPCGRESPPVPDSGAAPVWQPLSAPAEGACCAVSRSGRDTPCPPTTSGRCTARSCCARRSGPARRRLTRSS